MKYYSVVKTAGFTGEWKVLEAVILNEVAQSQKGNCCTIPLEYGC